MSNNTLRRNLSFNEVVFELGMTGHESQKVYFK